MAFFRDFLWSSKHYSLTAHLNVYHFDLAKAELATGLKVYLTLTHIVR